MNKDSFGLFIPQDIERHPDGAFASYIFPEERIAFLEYCSAQQIAIISKSGQEKEHILKHWRENISTIKPKPMRWETDPKTGKQYWEV